jgi:hypothetical protein
MRSGLGREDTALVEIVLPEIRLISLQNLKATEPIRNNRMWHRPGFFYFLIWISDRVDPIFWELRSFQKRAIRCANALPPYPSPQCRNWCHLRIAEEIPGPDSTIRSNLRDPRSKVEVTRFSSAVARNQDRVHGFHYHGPDNYERSEVEPCLSYPRSEEILKDFAGAWSPEEYGQSLIAIREMGHFRPQRDDGKYLADQDPRGLRRQEQRKSHRYSNMVSVASWSTENESAERSPEQFPIPFKIKLQRQLRRRFKSGLWKWTSREKQKKGMVIGGKLWEWTSTSSPGHRNRRSSRMRKSGNGALISVDVPSRRTTYNWERRGRVRRMDRGSGAIGSIMRIEFISCVHYPLSWWNVNKRSEQWFRS